jgi:hypothetical protein
MDVLQSPVRFSKNDFGKCVHGTAIEMAGVSTGKDNASTGARTIEKADAGDKRDLSSFPDRNIRVISRSDYPK